MSLNAFATAMAPHAAGLSTMGVKKSTVATSARSGDKRKDRGVVPGGGVDQDPGVPDCGQMAQDLRQIGGAELAGAAGAVGERGETNAGLLIDRAIHLHPSVSC